MSDVLVLNASYEPLHRVSVRHAIGMLYRQVAVVEEEVDGSRFGPYPMPRVLRLVRYVVMKWIYRGIPACTKAGVHARDGVCGYCGGKAQTVDHILPRSRGGGSNWTNLVAACRRCNARKGNRTAVEAGLRLRVKPYAPSHHELKILLTRPDRLDGM